MAAMEFLIRTARREDAGPILSIYRPFVEKSGVSFELSCPSHEEMGDRVERTLEMYPWIVAEGDGRVVGYAYGSQHRSRQAYQWSAEVSVYLSPSVRGMGLARKLYEILFELLRRQGVVNAYAGVTFPNEPSLKFHESMGFEKVGVYKNIGFKFGRWHDVGWWQLQLQDVKSPRDLVPFGGRWIDEIRVQLPTAGKGPE